MNIIVKLPVEIPDETLNELAKRAADDLINDERDLVPVVRCRDCKYNGIFYTCMFHGEAFTEDDFCSKGEREP